MKIVTECICPPIPCRDWDWQAYDDETYDGPGCLVGYGPTEEIAIAELLNQIEERAEAVAALKAERGG